MYRKKGFNFRRMVVVGVNPFSIDFVNEIIQHPEYGYKFLGFFGFNSSEEHENIRVQKFERIHNFLLEYEIDEVYIALPSDPDYHIKELIKFCHLNYIKMNFLNEFIHLLNKKTIQVNMDYNGPTPIVSVAKEPLEITANKFLKRSFDVVFSAVLFALIFSWLFPLVALFIKLNSPGPVFFKQKRTGLDGHSFYCYKFRTMKVNDEADTKQASEGDSRITKVGAILRKTNIDELPQFINVLAGEMSVVGPRPHMLSHTRMYSKLIAPFMVRHWVKPGITGLAQAKGFRGETKEVRQMYQRVRMDVFYIQNWSFWFDLKIVFMTVWNMITMQKTGA
jgi:Undecaprenyl-phosphate glucose phosphotransferase